MTTRRAVFPAILALLGVSSAASAQSPYVGVSVFGDIVRTTHTESSVLDEDPGSGEAVGFALRAGTPLASNWGVELEYARPSIFTRDAQLVYPLYSPLVTEGLVSFPTVLPPIYPIPLAIETRDRHTTVSAALWALQNVGERIAFVYLGGVAFNRFEREYEYGFGLPLVTGPGLTQRPSLSSRTIAYSTRPVIGLESWIELTAHITLRPGVRLHGVQDGWSLRPCIGLAWSF